MPGKWPPLPQVFDEPYAPSPLRMEPILYNRVMHFKHTRRPALALADYALSGMVLQIAVARALSALCGKQAALRWPNDVYMDQRKIAGVLSEVSGEGDVISWISGGVGVNVNNPALSGKSTSCAEILGHPVSRREILTAILNEADSAKRRLSSGAVYSQGNRALASEWNSLAAGIGAQAAVIDSGFGETKMEAGLKQNRVLARGVFAGVDPAGRCVIKNESGKGALYFNPGPVSLLLF